MYQTCNVTLVARKNGACKFYANSLLRAKVVFLLNNVMIINENKEMIVAVNAIYAIA